MKNSSLTTPQQPEKTADHSTISQKLPDYALLTEKETAAILRISTSKLQKDRVHGRGLRYVLCGKCVRYRLSDITAFIEANTRQSTSPILEDA